MNIYIYTHIHAYIYIYIYMLRAVCFAGAAGLRLLGREGPRRRRGLPAGPGPRLAAIAIDVGSSAFVDLGNRSLSWGLRTIWREENPIRPYWGALGFGGPLTTIQGESMIPRVALFISRGMFRISRSSSPLFATDFTEPCGAVATLCFLAGFDMHWIVSCTHELIGVVF